MSHRPHLFRNALLSLALAFLPGALLAGTPAAAPSMAHVESTAPSNVYYEIFVRSFYDSNGDGIGDLNGISEKLDYLKSLGVSGIWLTPINPSPSYHGYDITDYYGINPQFGTMADFEHLLAEAHKRGIKVLMDLVVNHTSNQSPWFKRAIDPRSRYHDWYTWAGKHTDLSEKSATGGPAWHAIDGQHYLGTFVAEMPDLNYDNPAVRQAIIKVGQFWLKKGVDGFRLDAARHIYENFQGQDHAPAEVAKNVLWWKQFRAAMRKVDPQVFLVGEVSADNEAQLAPYYAGLDSVFNFPGAEGLVMSAAREQSIDIGTQDQRAQAMFRRAAGGGAVTDTPFLSNHDQNRVLSQLEGNRHHMRMAVAMLLTLPGDPFIYYGEEIGMTGTKPDPEIREPMRWDRSLDARGETRWEPSKHNTSTEVSVAAERGKPCSLLAFYSRLIHWRKQLSALRDGSIAHYPADGGPISAYVRADAAQSLLVVHNLSGQPQQVHLTDVHGHRFGAVIRQAGGFIQLDGQTLRMPPYSTAILQ